MTGTRRIETRPSRQTAISPSVFAGRGWPQSQHPPLPPLPPVFRSLGLAVSAKDPYTGGHCSRVSLLAALVGEHLGLSDDLCRDIAIGGMLHDIGKIGVPEAVLCKEGRLTHGEVETVRAHPVLGESIVRPVLADRPAVLAVVRSHHERVDGCGYPDGLNGNEIPLPARIVAVVDAFDAMVSSRAYRPALSVAAALSELTSNIGGQFDRRCVEALVAIVARAATFKPVGRRSARSAARWRAPSMTSRATLSFRFHGVPRRRREPGPNFTVQGERWLLPRPFT